VFVALPKRAQKSWEGVSTMPATGYQMFDLSEFLPFGATYTATARDQIDVATRDAVYTLDVDCRTVTIRPVDQCFTLRDLRELLAQATSLESDMTDEAWECAEKFLGYEP
jgi:hypothetical protein